MQTPVQLIMIIVVAVVIQMMMMMMMAEKRYLQFNITKKNISLLLLR